jgi:putative ABC transport system permease protein
MDGPDSNRPSSADGGRRDEEAAVAAFDLAAHSGSGAARWRGLVELGIRRVWHGLVDGFPNRTVLSVTIIAVAIALTIVVAGVSIGLATGTSVYAEDIDYWIVPESGTTQSTLLSVEGPQLGDVHARTASIRQLDGVRDATPVLIEIIRVRAERSDEPEFVLGIGVVPSEGATSESIAAVSTASLSPGDPYYADGGTTDSSPERSSSRGGLRRC